MKNLKNLLIVLLIVMILSCCTISYAKVEVTKDKLQEAFNNLKNMSSDNNQIDSNIISVDESFEVEVTDDIINISSGEEKMEIKYTLTDKPSFTTEALVKNGMSYEEFEQEYNKVMYPLLGYMAVANIQGTKYEDALMYTFMNLLGTALSEGINSSEYIVYDDKEGNSIPQVSGNQKLIKQSEFDKYVMEYVNSIFKENESINDSEGINSYTWNVKQEEVTDSSCKIISTLSIDIDADFSKIEKLVDDLEDSFNSTTNNEIIAGTTGDKESDKKNTIANIDSIPKAGLDFGTKDILKIIIFVSVLSISIILITNKKEND